jgi:hypothetical protein
MAATTIKNGVIKALDSATGGISISASGWVESDIYGVYFISNTSVKSAQFDTVETRNGHKTAKLSVTTIGGGSYIFFENTPNYASNWPETNYYAIPCKPSTTYRVTAYMKCSGVGLTNGVRLRVYAYNADGSSNNQATSSSGVLVGTQDWTLVTVNITTGSTRSWIRILSGLVEGSDIIDGMSVWVDMYSLTFEEVITITNPGSNPATFRPLLQAVTTQNKIDKSLDPTGAYANTYTCPSSINEGATHRQTFVPTKKFLAQMAVKIVSKGTGNWRIVVHDSSNNPVGGTQDPNNERENANLTNGAFNLFPIMTFLTPGQTYHFHVICESADGTISSNVASDEENCSFICYYGTKTDNFTIRTATEELSINADSDGFLHGAQIDLHNKQFRYNGRYQQSGDVIDKVPWYLDVWAAFYGTTNWFSNIWSNGLAVGGSIEESYTIKVNTIFPATSMSLGVKPFIAAGRSEKFQYSFDNTNWVDIATYTNANSGITNAATIPVSGQNIVYLKMVKINNTCYLRELDITADIDVSSITLPTLAPGENTVYFSSNSNIANSGNDPSFTMIMTPIVPVIASKSLAYAVRKAWSDTKDLRYAVTVENILSGALRYAVTQAGYGLISLGLAYSVTRPGRRGGEVILSSREGEPITLASDHISVELPSKERATILSTKF